MASAASTIMQPTDTRDFEAFYGLLARCDIEGFNAATRKEHFEHKQLNW